MQQPRQPHYRGRPLPRPDDEVVDQGLGFDLGTLLDRRQLLRAFGLGATTLGLAACGGTSDGEPPTATTATATSGEIPDETGGPYPGDGSNGPNVLDDSGIVRSDLRSSFGAADGTAEGVPMTLELTVLDVANGGRPFAGTAVYLWHCDREGRYSLYSEGVEDQNYLRGVQIADGSGRVRFTTVFPGCYAGRWPHLHFEVYPDRAGLADAGNAIATSQVALPKEACDKVYAETGYQASVGNLAALTLASDNVFGDDGGATQLGTATGDVTAGYAVSLPVRVDTRTAPTGG
ncbi:dioxygenase family protein [Jidongwangia harbinensis]|uniref:dioxygenase family protein n=1 Tax=Jidongwangia harbinensis TaxID=2878561 RepID=UPI001CD9F51B|nr:3,4-dioxygenase subunit beta [Jidongwangia harbinensis]MCA2213335.1 3,4-dioxygenase subunit beta [Jidongwangia harbinensis]